MKHRWLLWLIVPLGLCAADEAKTAKKPAAPASQASKPAPEAGVPAGAVQQGPNVWRYTDRDGKNWLYNKTPFGVMKSQEQPASEAKIPEGMRATEDGDSVRFERPGPFGAQRWTKKKDQLDELERKVWERDSKKPDSASQRGGAESKTKE